MPSPRPGSRTFARSGGSFPACFASSPPPALRCRDRWLPVLAAEFLDTIRECLPAPIKVERTSLLDVLKAVKSETEIRNMKVAGWLADVGCEAIAEKAAAGVTERELARAAYSAMFEAGADTIAFDVFIQTGRENTETFYLKRPTDRALRMATSS